MSDLLTLSTEVAPAKKFMVDGEEYQLLGLDHLSADDEAKTMALFARHSLLASELEMTINTNKGTELALRLKKTRLQIITQVTDLPMDIAENLKVSGQVALLQAIQQELSANDEDDDEGSSKKEEPTKVTKPRTPQKAAAGSSDDDDDD